jgi:iron complex outermembrane recepter protein
MNKFLWVCFSFFLFCVTGFSQNTISGKTTTTEPIALSEVHIHIGKKTVSSDEYGKYSIKNVPNGNLKVHVSHIGYVSIDTIIELTSNLNLNFILKPKTAILNEVVIKQKETSQSISILEQKLKTETIQKYSNQSLGDALREISGVSSLKTGVTVVKPIINGLYGSRVSILNNNVKLEDQEWGTEHTPSFDINAAGKITVIKGASGLQYGGSAIGGLVLIEPLVSRIDTLFGKSILNFDSNGKGGSISSSIHRGNVSGISWNVLGTFKYMGDRESPSYVLSNTGNREANFTGDLKYSGKKFDFTSFYSFYNATIGILSASHIGNATDLYNAIDNKIPNVVRDFTYSIRNPKQEVQHHIAKISSNYYRNENMMVSFQYAFQCNKRLEFDVRRQEFANKPALDLELITHALNFDFKKTSHDWDMKSGVSTSFQNNLASPLTDIRPLIPNYNKFDLGLYTILTYRFSDSFSMDSGIRYELSSINAAKFYFKTSWDENDYDAQFKHFIVGESENGMQWLVKPQFNFQNVSASLGFLKKYDSNLNWFFNTSLATRNPNPSEFFSEGLHHSTGIIELGDLRLKQEQSVKFSTSLQKKTAKFYLEITPFLNRISNYMYLTPIGLENTIRGSFPVWEYQQTKAVLTGIDMTTHWNWSENWFQNFELAYVNGQDMSKNLPIIEIPPLHLNTKIQYSNAKWHHLLLSLKADMVFTQSRFPNNDFFTNIVVEGNLEPRLVKISTPPPAYELLHFYSEMKFKTFKKSWTTLVFSVQNIFNTEYRDYLNKQRFFANEMGRNLQIQLKINY